mmetsp:Transcript_25185/g.47357  ORF Transcript_25185/g.47357 Transcript_25185/m.47357 type:complete len:213 (-) Transcript_25185:705-1343(-)
MLTGDDSAEEAVEFGHSGVDDREGVMGGFEGLLHLADGSLDSDHNDLPRHDGLGAEAVEHVRGVGLQVRDGGQVHVHVVETVREAISDGLADGKREHDGEEVVDVVGDLHHDDSQGDGHPSDSSEDGARPHKSVEAGIDGVPYDGEEDLSNEPSHSCADHHTGDEESCGDCDTVGGHGADEVEAGEESEGANAEVALCVPAVQLEDGGLLRR